MSPTSYRTALPRDIFLLYYYIRKKSYDALFNLFLFLVHRLRVVAKVEPRINEAIPVPICHLSFHACFHEFITSPFSVDLTPAGMMMMTAAAAAISIPKERAEIVFECFFRAHDIRKTITNIPKRVKPANINRPPQLSLK